VTRAAGGSLERRDVDTTRDVISIGRATDQTIYLADRRVALNHATITAQPDGRCRIESLAFGGVSINGKIRRAAVLDVGDHISIGGYDLAIVGPPAGWDLVLTVEQVDVVQISTGKENLGLAGTAWSRRRLAWILFVGTLLFALGVPLLQPASPGKAGAPLAALPSTAAWSPGPLLPAHELLAKDCGACHTEPFEPVADQACLACHQQVPAHVPAGHPTTRELSEAQCIDCHREHKEPRQLVATHQGICADCHADLSSHPGITTELRNASDFGTAHPPFALTHLVPQGQGEATTWSSKREPGDGAVPVERSNLKFTHALHLAPDGIKGPDGKPKFLDCVDCHRGDTSGRFMQPVRMETDCRSCHKLVFDANAPKREVPHGTPTLVQMTLEEFYSRQFLNEAMDAIAGGKAERDVRRPGRAVELTPAQRAQAADRAHRQALTVASDLFERRACATCHVIMVDRNDGEARYDVEPVRLTTRWMPKSEFSHLAHRETDCETCHRAEASASAADVLMPTLEDCRSCHTGEARRGEERIASGCMMCHGFHVTGAGAMKDQ
jgi:predicted CXXCH cytochrome family protein